VSEKGGHSRIVEHFNITSIDVKFHAKSDILYKRFIELFKKYHDYKEFQRGIDEFNCVQSALEKKVNTLSLL